MHVRVILDECHALLLICTHTRSHARFSSMSSGTGESGAERTDSTTRLLISEDRPPLPPPWKLPLHARGRSARAQTARSRDLAISPPVRRARQHIHGTTKTGRRGEEPHHHQAPHTTRSKDISFITGHDPGHVCFCTQATAGTQALLSLSSGLPQLELGPSSAKRRSNHWFPLLILIVTCRLAFR